MPFLCEALPPSRQLCSVTDVKTNSKCPAGQGAKPSPSVVGQEAKASPNIVGQGAKASPRVVEPFSGDAPHCPAQDSSCLRTSQQIAAEGPRDADGSSELEQCPSRGTYWDIRFQPRRRTSRSSPSRPSPAISDAASARELPYVGVTGVHTQRRVCVTQQR